MLPRPRVTIRERTEMRKGPDGQRHNDRSDLDPPPRRHRRRQQIEYRHKRKDGEIECGEIVMEEELALHEEEGEIVQCPSENGEPDELVVLDNGRVVEILITTLLAQHEQGPHADVQDDGD